MKIIESPAQKITPDGLFDGVLMFGANEIFTLEEALDNIFAYLKEDVRVAVMGAKLVERGWRKIFNPLFRMLASKLMLPSTPSLNFKPWQLLEERMDEFHIEEYVGGFMYLIWGSVSAGKKSGKD